MPRLLLPLDWNRVSRQWETWLATLVVLMLVVGAVASPNLLDVGNLFSVGQEGAVELLMAIGLTPVVLAGEIDLSVTSVLEVCLVTMALLWQNGVPIWVAAGASLGIGCLLGLVNGLLVVYLELPSLAVTIGTLVAYSGIALLELGGGAITGFPASLVWLGVGTIGGTGVPVAVLILALVAVIIGIVIHSTRLGRYIYAVGGNREAARFAGDPVNAVKVFVFVLSGFFAAVAAIMYAAYLNTAVADAASTDLLMVVTVVLFGGIDFVGGSGSVAGVLMAFILLGGLQKELGLDNVPGQIQLVIVGVLLIAAVSAKNLLGGFHTRKEPSQRPTTKTAGREPSALRKDR